VQADRAELDLWNEATASVFVGGGGLIPQVEFGTVGLHLAPHGERAEPSQYDQQYLDLHSEEPSASMTSGTRSQTHDQEIPAAYQAHGPRRAYPIHPRDDTKTAQTWRTVTQRCGGAGCGHTCCGCGEAGVPPPGEAQHRAAFAAAWGYVDLNHGPRP